MNQYLELREQMNERARTSARIREQIRRYGNTEAHAEMAAANAQKANGLTGTEDNARFLRRHSDYLARRNQDRKRGHAQAGIWADTCLLKRELDCAGARMHQGEQVGGNEHGTEIARGQLRFEF